MRKYLNSLLFGAVVLVVVGMAVVHNRHMQSLREDLTGPDPQAHLRAANELIKAESFSDIITGETPQTRRQIAQALQDVPSPDGVKQALAMLKDQDKTVRAAALATLKKIGATSPDTVKALINGLKDGNVNVRKGIIAALIVPATEGGIGPRPEVLDAVLAIIKKEGDARGPGGDVLSSPRFLAQEVRAKSVPVLIGYLSEKDDGVKRGAADGLGKIGDPQAVPALTGMVQNETLKPDVRRVATGALALIASRDSEPLLTAAITNTNTDNEVRAQVARGLGKIGTKSAIATLIQTLDDDDLKLRSASVAALARACQESLDIDKTVDKTADKVQNTSFRIPDLIAALNSPKPTIRFGAVQALQPLHIPTADSALIKTLLDTQNSSALRIAAANALGFPNNTVAVQPLIQTLNATDGEVAAAAQNALQQVGPAAVPPLLSLLQKGGPDALYAAQAIGRQGNAALPALQSALATASPIQQRWLAVALGEANSPNALPALKQLAASTDETVKYVAQQQLNRVRE